jgi:hypothetical protein
MAGLFSSLISSSYPELFIKNATAFFSSAISGIYPDIAEKTFQEESFYIHRHFLPFGRADLSTSASLWPIRGIQIQHHGPLPCRCSNLNS